MRVYNSKVQQTCSICNKVFSNNKSGRFTSHLRNDHQMTLDEYLVRYFYAKEQLSCAYELCDEQVKLTRGIPNRFCSSVCRSMGEPLFAARSLPRAIAKRKHAVRIVQRS